MKCSKIFEYLEEQRELEEGMGRKRAKSVEHENKDAELDVEAIKKTGKKMTIKNQSGMNVDRYYFKEGPLKGAFYTQEESPTGESKFTYKNGSIVTPKGSSITADDINTHSKQYHKKSPAKSSSSKSTRDDKPIAFRTAEDEEGETYKYPIFASKKKKS